MNMLKPADWWDRLFILGIILKGVDGAVELIGGVLLLLATPANIHNLVVALTRGELSEDPSSFVANHLLNATAGLTQHTLVFGALYLLLHGAVKVALVVALLLNKLWAYPWMIVALLAFAAYQAYEILRTPTATLVVLTAFDVVVVVLTWHEYLRQRKHRTT